MSRPIELRAWVDEFNYYAYDIQERTDMFEWFGHPTIHIEQYTGVKDKNGREIYEGDIVKGRWWRAKNARLDTEGEIKFNDGWFYIKDDPDGQDRLGVPIHNCYNLEVIGNIHENPELLEKGEDNE